MDVRDQLDPGDDDALGSGDAGSDREVPDLDLRPRTRAASPGRRWLPIAMLVVILAGLGFVATRALGDATQFFLNADEAVARKADLADSRFKLQGTVVPGTISDTGSGVDFTVRFNGVEVAVVHQGDPPELFQPDMPVVLEGRWDPSGDVFSSDRMLVKHDEQYETDNDVRMKDAEQGGQAGASANVR